MPKKKQRSSANSTDTTTPGKVNLKLLSKHLGLSSTTISLVLNDAPLAKRLSAKTRERVLQAAAELGYKPNYFARSLSGKRSEMIGVLAPDFGDGYGSVLLSGIERQLLDRGYIYFVSSHLWSSQVLTRGLDTLIERGAEGLLLINTPLPAGITLPTVNIGSALSTESSSLISIDNQFGMKLTLEHLVSLGHRRIAVLKGQPSSADTEERWEAVQIAAQDVGVELPPHRAVQLERLGMEGLLGIDEGYIATQKLLQQGIDFTAIICFNDTSACGAMNALRDAGLRIPQDVSVIGFDDLPLAKGVYPTLTTIRQPLHEMGEQAALNLISRIENKSLAPIRVCVKPNLVVRNSTGAAPKTK